MAVKRHAGDAEADGAVARHAKRALGSKNAPDAARKAAKAMKPVKAARADADKPVKSALDVAFDDTQTAAAAKGHRKRRRPPTATDLSAEEQARREHQRKRRAIAMKVRAEGKEYKRQPLKAARGAVQKASAAKPAAAVQRRYDDVDPGKRPDGPVQVIVVPIFWNKRVHEKGEVLEAAQRACDMLTESGIAAGCDTTVEMSPGQKYRHWEEAGVKVRVEVGPKEAALGQCILAICTTPGEVAAKSTMQAGAPLLKAVRRALGLGTVSEKPVPKPRAREHTEAVAAAALPDRAVAAQPQQAAVVAVPPQQRFAASGDDYADDFEELVEPDEENKKTLKSRKAKQTESKRPKTVVM